MSFDMGDRHTFRANWHDYNDGIYFVTICCAEKAHLFGKILNNEMALNELGHIANESILDLSNHHNVEVWNHIVMPNHIHLVLQVGTRPVASTVTNSIASYSKMGCLKPPRHGEQCENFHHNSQLAVVVGSLKSAVTRKYRMLMRTRQAASLQAIWQKRYYEHIIRNQPAFDNIMEYVTQNVVRWSNDFFNQE